MVGLLVIDTIGARRGIALQLGQEPGRLPAVFVNGFLKLLLREMQVLCLVDAGILAGGHDGGIEL